LTREGFDGLGWVSQLLPGSEALNIGAMMIGQVNCAPTITGRSSSQLVLVIR